MSGKYKPAKGPIQAQQHFRLSKGQLLAALIALISIGGALFWLISRGNKVANFTPEVTGAPSVEVAQQMLDHGDVKMNTPIESVFRVRNRGDQALLILGEPQVEVIEGC
jgi:hypothetical protein